MVWSGVEAGRPLVDIFLVDVLALVRLLGLVERRATLRVPLVGALKVLLGIHLSFKVTDRFKFLNSKMLKCDRFY